MVKDESISRSYQMEESAHGYPDYDTDEICSPGASD